MTEERCKHELLIGQCDLCKPRAAADPFTAPAEWGYSAPFSAQYAGQCAECGWLFDPGDSIRSCSGGYVCAECGE
jgi:hypothetical protein